MSVYVRNLYLIHETELAVLVEQDIKGRHDRNRAWLPKSALDYRKNYTDPEKGKMLDVKVSEKLANEKQLTFDD